MAGTSLPRTPLPPPQQIVRKIRPLRLSGAAAIAVLAAFAGGCGTDPSAAAARRSVQAFYGALGRHDGAAACRRLSDDARSSLESSEKKPCKEAVFSLGLSPSPVLKVRVDATSAQARLAGGEAVFLDQFPDGWRISAVGCKPKPKQPYDCQLEA